MTPETQQDVQRCLAELRSTGRTALVTGGGTAANVGDATPTDVTLHTGRLSGVGAHTPADLTCTVGAGTTLDELNATLERAGQTLPVWHPLPDRATVGGLVAYGWRGLGASVYGRLRDRVLEVRVVTGEGKLVRGGGKVVKNVTGFDLPRLFCGSMGTLGVIVEATLKVHPLPGRLSGARWTGEQAAPLVRRLRRLVLKAPIGVEAVVVRDGDTGAWEGALFVPGGEDDARALLGDAGDDHSAGAEWLGEAWGEFEALARHRLLAPQPADWDPGTTVCRAVLPPSHAEALAGLAADAPQALIDVAGGIAWFGARSTEEIAGARASVESNGGALVLLHAPEAVRRRIGTWGTAPPGAEIARRLKEGFDPGNVLGPGRMPADG